MKTFLCSHLVMLVSNGHRIPANLEKISAALATVNSEESIPVGTLLRIDTENDGFDGKVARCEMDALGYFIEIELNEPWSEEVFRPDHFFDPEQLLPH